MAKRSKDPWDQKTCKLLAAPRDMPKLLLNGKNASNEFKLVAGSRTRGGVKYYKVQAKPRAIAHCWRNCIFVPRGNRAPKLKESLGRNPTRKQILAVAKKLLTTAKLKPVSTQHLDCDVRMPVTGVVRAGESASKGGRSKMIFGSLRLYQVPRKLGNDGLLAFKFAADGNPGGSGGAGSVHN